MSHDVIFIKSQDAITSPNLHWTEPMHESESEWDEDDDEEGHTFDNDRGHAPDNRGDVPLTSQWRHPCGTAT